MFNFVFKKETIAVAALLLSGATYASGPITQDAAISELKRTLNSTPACIVLKEFQEFPVILEKLSHSNNRIRAALNKLSDAGLLSHEEKMVTRKKTMGMVVQNVTENADLYSLTELGKKHFRTDAVMITRGRGRPVSGPGLCYANSIDVAEIKSFRGTVIEYSINGVDRAEWADNKDLIASGLILDREIKPNVTYSTGNLADHLAAQKQASSQEVKPSNAQARASFARDASGKYQLTYY